MYRAQDRVSLWKPVLKPGFHEWGQVVLWISICLLWNIILFSFFIFSIFFKSLKIKSTQIIRPQKGNLQVLFYDTLLNFGLRCKQQGVLTAKKCTKLKDLLQFQITHQRSSLYRVQLKYVHTKCFTQLRPVHTKFVAIKACTYHGACTWEDDIIVKSNSLDIGL